MIFVLADMRQNNYHNLHYFDSITEAECVAVDMMDEVGITWGRGEFYDGRRMEYIKRHARGAARVYVRIYETTEYQYCQCGEIAVVEDREGYFCRTHSPYQSQENEDE